MITQESKNGSQTNYAKLHCPDCRKTLSLKDFGLNPIEESAVELLMSTALRHQQKHPTHNMTVTTYLRTPAHGELQEAHE